MDDDEFKLSVKEDASAKLTIGEYVESLLTNDRYFTTVLPRLPTPIKRQLEAKLVQVGQERRRAKANRRLLDTYKERGVRVEVCSDDGEWRPAETLEVIDETTSRPKLRVRLGFRLGSSSSCGGARQEADREDSEAEEAVVHIGRVILSDSRYESRPSRARRSRSRSSGGGAEKRSSRARRSSRSRSGSVDWARERGKSTAELLEEHRRREQDRAVCAQGKDYCRRPVSFQVALPMEMGNATRTLSNTNERRQDEQYVASGEARGGGGAHHRREAREQERERSRSPEWRRQESLEYKARMRQLFEKYGQAKPSAQEDRRRGDIDAPDVMRLG